MAKHNYYIDLIETCPTRKLYNLYMFRCNSKTRTNHAKFTLKSNTPPSLLLVDPTTDCLVRAANY